MSQNIVALDLGSGQITGALVVYDENTGTCRVRHAVRQQCPAVSACYILDFDRAARAVSAVLRQLCEAASFAPTVVVGLRGGFLSFRRSGGTQSIESNNSVITSKDVRAALDNSVPESLDENLEVVNLLPQSFTIDGKTGIQKPEGLVGNFLEAETFLSCALSTHLSNLNRVMTAAGYEDFEAVPTVLALCDSLVKPEEKQAGVLLLDLGAANSSAALYHKGLLEGAWEIPLGADLLVQEVAEVLQNDLKSARETLRQHPYGEDEVMDDLLDEAALHLMQKIKRELLQGSLAYIKYPPRHMVLTGGGSGLAAKNAAEKVFSVRRARLAGHDDLIADSEELTAPQYTSALSLALHSQRHGGPALGSVAEKTGGFLGRVLAKLGLN